MDTMTQNQNVRLLVGFIIGVLIGVGGMAIWNHRSPAQTSNSTVSENTNTTGSSTTLFASSTIMETDAPGGVKGDGPGIVVEEQNPGKLVIVSQVALLKPGWVVIRDNSNGKPGNILGVKLFDKGKNSGLVQLLRAMVIGKKYFAEIHNDDGDYKNFDAQKDTVIKDANGNAIMTTFAVTQASDRQQ